MVLGDFCERIILYPLKGVSTHWVRTTTLNHVKYLISSSKVPLPKAYITSSKGTMIWDSIFQHMGLCFGANFIFKSQQ